MHGLALLRLVIDQLNIIGDDLVLSTTVEHDEERVVVLSVTIPEHERI